LEAKHWVNSYWLKDKVRELVSDRIILALKPLAYQMVRESKEPPQPDQGWLEKIDRYRREPGLSVPFHPGRDGVGQQAHQILVSCPSQYFLRISRFRILPVGFKGRVSQNSTVFGHLYPARFSLQ
jgi:hypothetical protein